MEAIKPKKALFLNMFGGFDLLVYIDYEFFLNLNLATVGQTCGNIIPNGETVVSRATTEINIYDGFDAMLGSYFDATIGECYGKFIKE
jgi:hypothetical protein